MSHSVSSRECSLATRNQKEVTRMILINGSATQWGKLINRWRERVGLRSIRKEARYQLIRESEASRAEEIRFEK